jgi:hypothetical protein
MTGNQIQWLRTPWLLRKIGYKPWRYWTSKVHLFGDFSEWTYAETPTPSTDAALTRAREAGYGGDNG